jgi:hypothetical protein
MLHLAAHCHLGLGKLFQRTGNQPNAAEHLAIAATMYREMDTGFWLEKAGERGPAALRSGAGEGLVPAH